MSAGLAMRITLAVDEIPELLRRERRAREITQEQLGEKAGLSESMISLFERGERECSLASIIRIANALDLDFQVTLVRRNDGG